MRIGWLLHKQSWHLSAFTVREAFCTDTYEKIQAHNMAHPDAPMTLAPSFGFLSKFKSTNGYAYPGGKSENLLGLVLNEESLLDDIL